MGYDKRNVPLRLFTSQIKILSKLLNNFKKFFFRLLMKNIFFLVFSLSIFASSYAKNVPVYYSDDDYIPKCGKHLNLEKKEHLYKILNIRDSLYRPITQKKSDAPGGLFVIHYDTTGVNAVNLEDKNSNGIPDYIDSVAFYFNYAYKIEIDSMHYISPAFDSGLGGSNAYDIYVLDIGNGPAEDVVYGYTITEDKINSSSIFPKFTSFITVDNNFSPLDSMVLVSGKKKQSYLEHGINALKITAAHEFYHAIQLMYGDDQSSFSLNEMTATYMEFRVHPGTVDYIQFVRSLFNYPEKYIFSDGYYINGYRYAIFGQYIFSNFGDNLLRRMWEIIANGYSGFDAMNKAFVEKNSTLAKEWCKFLPWLYHTGSRTIDGKYFPQSGIFPQFKFFSDTTYSDPSWSESDAIRPFELRAFRTRFKQDDPAKSNDTLDIFISNTDLEWISNPTLSDRTRPYTLSISENQQSGSQQLNFNNKLFYYNLLAEKSDIFDTLFVQSGIATNILNYAYPNPFRRDVYTELFFPAPLNAKLGDVIYLKIFDTGLNLIYQTQLQVDVDMGNKVGILNKIPDEIPNTGIFIFSIDYHGQITFGKFTIIR